MADPVEAIGTIRQMVTNETNGFEIAKDPEKLEKILERWKQKGSTLLPIYENNERVGTEVVLSKAQRARLGALVAVGGIFSFISTLGESGFDLLALIGGPVVEGTTYFTDSTLLTVIASLISQSSRVFAELTDTPHNPPTLKEELEVGAFNELSPATGVAFSLQNILVTTRGRLRVMHRTESKDLSVNSVVDSD